MNGEIKPRINVYVAGAVQVRARHYGAITTDYGSVIPESVHVSISMPDGYAPEIDLWGPPQDIGRVLRSALDQIEAALATTETAA